MEDLSFFLRLLVALDEGRHRQAALEIKRHAHMVSEAAAYEVARTDHPRRAAELPARLKPAT
jgi:hypothetical protein